MSQSHKEVIYRFIDEAINKGNHSVLDELLHPNYIFRSSDQVIKGAQALKGFFAALRNAFPDLHLNIDDLLVEDEKLVSSFTLTGTHEAEFMGIPTTGNSINIHGMVLSRFREGKIIEEWEVLDQLTLLQQLGVVALPK
jgi:steroid delta-isomerase-like uncharacterized protein